MSSNDRCTKGNEIDLKSVVVSFGSSGIVQNTSIKQWKTGAYTPELTCVAEDVIRPTDFFGIVRNKKIYGQKSVIRLQFQIDNQPNEENNLHSQTIMIDMIYG